jgi:uncharacterized membrane protein
MLVHFPLALVLTAGALLLAARLWPRPGPVPALATVGTWNLVLGAAGVVLALASGLAALLDVHLAAAARAAVGLHVKWAIGSALLVVLLAVWRGAGAKGDSKPSWLFLLLLVAACAGLVETGYRGGVNVYRYGVGVGD